MKRMIPMLGLAALLLLAGCHSNRGKRDLYFNQYMAEHFPGFEIRDGEYLLLRPGSCPACEQGVYAMLERMLSLPPDSNYVNANYQAVLVSGKTLEEFPRAIPGLHERVLCDTTNSLDKMLFGVSGIAVLKIQNRKISSSKSLTTEIYMAGPEKFFRERMYR